MMEIGLYSIGVGIPLATLEGHSRPRAALKEVHLIKIWIISELSWVLKL
jgi:hypothetical protein